MELEEKKKVLSIIGGVLYNWPPKKNRPWNELSEEERQDTLAYYEAEKVLQFMEKAGYQVVSTKDADDLSEMSKIADEYQLDPIGNFLKERESK